MLFNLRMVPSARRNLIGVLCFRYEKSPRFERAGYEEDFMHFLQTLLSDVEKRIRRGQARLALNSTNSGVSKNISVW